MPVSGPHLIQADASTRLTIGESTLDRFIPQSAAVSPNSGTMRLTYFTAQKTEVVNNVRVMSGTTAAAATPTLVRVGIYEAAANGDLTLVGSTANDTALFANTNTRYTKALSAPFTKVAGRRYAVGILTVSAAATPSFLGTNFGSGLSASANAEFFSETPRIAANLTGLADLPSSVADASLATTAMTIYAVVLP